MDIHNEVAATDSSNPPAEVLDLQVIQHVLWFYGDPVWGLEPGHFTVALLTAFVNADLGNFALLASSFPAQGYWVRMLRHHPEGMQIAVDAAQRLAARS
ncbi:hypothetical protein ACFVR6_03870 [Microbacterium sp. NPDC058021]|uniref:hypothetical protein n=1 Tax=Microbacterium sp. NPDC058021 TaxID=3346306 RepID=UPI0036DCD8BC